MAFRTKLIDGISGEDTFRKPKSQVGNPRRKLRDQLRNVEIFARRPNRSESTFKADNDDSYELATESERERARWQTGLERILLGT